MPSDDAMLFLLKRMERAQNNQEFFEQMAEA
jgi:transcription termination factor Rho